MPLSVPSVDNVDQATVDEQSAVATRLAGEYNPSADLKRGVLHDYVLHLAAVMAAVNQTNNQRVAESMSLRLIQADPSLADTELVDNVLSNWGVARKAGAAAAGPVAIALSEPVTVAIPQGALFGISGRTFLASGVFVARTDPADVVSPSDRLLAPSGGLWVFLIDVVDQAPGTAGNVTRGESAVPAQPPSKFATAYVDSDFAGGVDTETNEQLVARLPSGLAAKLWGGRGNIDGLIKYQFPDTLDVSVIGFGDAEMRRDQHLLWPGSSGGRADVHVRTSRAYLSTTITKTATLLSKDGAAGTWQFAMARDDVPGFYEVEKILAAAQPASAAGFQPSADVRGYDLTDDGLGPTPDITSVIEAVYSYFQTAQIQFVDTATDAGALSPGAVASYQVVVRHLPRIKDVQNFLRGRAVGSTLCDALVKAVVPCFTGVSLTLTVPRGSPAPDVPALRQSVADTINTLGLIPRLTVSQAIRPVVRAHPDGAVTGATLVGRLRRPDGTILSLVSTDAITLPAEPDRGVTNRTASFLCSPRDVAIAVVQVDSPVV